MKRVIIMGSPRANGRCAHLAEMLFEACIDECPEDEQYLAPISELEIAGCIACDACKKAGEASAQAKLSGGVAPADVPGESEDADDLLPIPYCPRFDDDMLDLYDVLFDADELTIVAPVFFSGAPAGLTALLDRLQPYFWEWLALRAAGDEGKALAAQKRPATLHVIGEGLDKNGYVALVSKVRSALAPAGFRLERVLDWVGKIDADGTITGEADEYALPPLGAPLVSSEAYLLTEKERPQDAAPAAAPAAVPAKKQDAAPAPARSQGGGRPKLDLGGGKGGAAKSGRSKGSPAGGDHRSGKSGKAGGGKKNGKRRG